MKEDPRNKAFTESMVSLMRFNDYQKLASRTINPELSKNNLILDGLMGCSGEAGEALDIMKKHLFQGHSLNRDEIIKELGDQLWYISETATGLGISLSEIADKNIQKLIARYPSGFSKEKSINREERKC